MKYGFTLNILSINDELLILEIFLGGTNQTVIIWLVSFLDTDSFCTLPLPFVEYDFNERELIESSSISLELAM